MTDKEKIKELEAKLAEYESNPAANFYKAFTRAFDEISKQIDLKTFDADEPFTKSILKLGEKNEVIFRGLKEGISVFQQQKVVDEKKETKIAKSQSVAL